MSNRYLVILFFVVIVMIPAQVIAEAWVVKPTISINERYSDNYELSSTAASSVWETALRSTFTLSRLTETASIHGSLNANFNSHSIDEQYLTLDAEYHGLRSRFQTKGFFRRDSTIRTVAISDTGQDDEEDVDTGFIQVEKQRNTLELKPGWAFQKTERLSMGVLYTFRTAFYEGDNRTLGLYDYERHGVGLNTTWLATERDVLALDIGGSLYDSEESASDSLNMVLVGSYSHRFTELTHARIILGLQNTRVGSGETEFVDNSWLSRLRLVHKLEGGELDVDIRHDLFPSGLGSLVETNQVLVKLKKQLAPRLFALLRGKAIETKSLGNSARDRNYYGTVSPVVGWSLSRWWSFNLGYQLNVRERVNSSDDAHSNMIIVSISYSKREELDY